MSPLERHMNNLNRRSFLANVTLATGVAAATGTSARTQISTGEAAALPDWIPQQDPAVVKEMVGVAHGNLARVRELVERQPALANATVDWGFGDWEDALGAASHMGRREIAELLLAHGARPTIFSAAMLGQLDVVKAFVAASPGVQRTLGPHGITLLAHARAGGAGAAEVVKYLESVSDADRRPPTQPLAPADRAALVGEYSFGPTTRDRFVIDVRDDQLGIERPGHTRRMLFHTGSLVFFPSGVPSFRIAFARAGGPATQLTLADPEVFLTAKRLG
jgi:hypothetical protein